MLLLTDIHINIRRIVHQRPVRCIEIGSGLNMEEEYCGIIGTEDVEIVILCVIQRQFLAPFRIRSKGGY